MVQAHGVIVARAPGACRQALQAGVAAAHERADRLALEDPQQHARLAHVEDAQRQVAVAARSEEHTSELQSLMRISYAVFCLKKKKKQSNKTQTNRHNTI